MKLRFILSFVLASGISYSNSYAQAPGIIYPTNPGSVATGPSVPASSPPAGRAASASATASSTASPRVAQIAVAASAAAASSPSPAVLAAVAKLNAASVQAPSNPASSPAPLAVISAPKNLPSATRPSSQQPIEAGDRVTVKKLADGRQVFKSTPSMAQAELALASQMGLPAIQPGTAPLPSAPSVPSGPPSTPFGDSVKPLPKWVTQNLDRTQGQTKLVVSQGVTEIVKIARNFPNRFVTPFEFAEVVTTDEALTHDGVGGSVIVATSSDKPIGIFIQDRNSDRAIPLVLIPEDIPQRELRLVLDDAWGPPVLRNSPDASGSVAGIPIAQTDYVDYIKNVMRSMAKGDIPDGHALSQVQPELVPACQIPGLSVRLGQMLEGSKDRVVVYLVTNDTRATVAVQESGCYRMGVLAAAAFPRPVLEPGQSTELYVLVRKDSNDAPRTGKRRPTLVN